MSSQARKVLAACLVAACLVVVAFVAYPQTAPVFVQGGEASAPLDASDRKAAASSSEASSVLASDGDARSSVVDAAQADAETDAVPQEPSGERCEGEVLVELADGCTAQDLNEAIAGLDYVTTESVSDDDVALGFVTLNVDPGCDLDWVLGELEDCDAVAGTQPNYVYHLLGDEVSDGALSTTAAGQSALAAGGADSLTQFGLNDSVAAASYNNRWWLEAVGALKAWKTRKTAGSVTVAVIDTGCDTSHEDLAGAVSAANCYNARTGATGFSAVRDTAGHGTHVCGIISATPNNSKGIAGVSYGAKLMPVKVADGATTSSSHLVKAYNFIMKRRAAGENVRVVNVSLGGTKGYDAAVMRAIDRAYTKYGILSVFAAGNNVRKTPYYCFPCDYSESGVGVIGVAKQTAVSLRGSCSSSSNYNVGSEKTKDISAPCMSIVSTYPANLSADSSYGKGYKALSGTSMAAPIVAGTAALVWAQNPSLTPGQVKSVLCTTASDIRRLSGRGAGFDAYTGYGLVRADKAVAGAKSSYLKGKDSVAAGSSIWLAVPRSGKWKWSSNARSVARVTSSGKVKGISAGEAVITATNTSTGAKLRRTVVVYSAKVTGKSKIAAGKKATMRLKCSPIATCTWTSSNKKVAKVNSTSGRVTAKKKGTAVIRARLTAAPKVKISKKITVVKGRNPMKVKASIKKVSYAKLKKKTCNVYKAIVFKRAAKGKVTYTKVSKGSSDRLTINKKTGKIRACKGTKRGTYKIKVKVHAAGNASYKELTRTVVVRVKVV